MNKTIFITGAAGGLGSQISHKFAGSGYQVAIGYLNTDEKEKAETLKSQLAGDGHITVECNIDVTESVQHARDEVVEKFGTLSVFVNNAGWTKFVAHEDLQGLDDDLMEGILRTHVKGYLVCIREFEPVMADGSCIINMSSIAGRTGIGSNIVYCAAKGAVDVMTRSLARALAPRVRVLAVAPGCVDTGIIQGLDRSWYDQQRQRTPMQAFAEPKHIADTVYACVEHLTFTTGDTIYSDGGRKLEETVY